METAIVKRERSDSNHYGANTKKPRFDEKESSNTVKMEFPNIDDTSLEKIFGMNGKAVRHSRENRKALDEAMNLPEHQVFWSEKYKEECLKESVEEYLKEFPELRIGVLGTTGTG